MIKKILRNRKSKSLTNNFSAKSSQNLEKIKNLLEKNENLSKSKSIEKYMKYSIKYRGIQSPQLKLLFKKIWTEYNIKDLSLEEKKDLSYNLIKSDYGEEKSIGMEIYGKIYKELDINYFSTIIKSLFIDSHIKDWAICDGMCIKVIKFWVLLSKNNLLYVSSWANEENIWLKRASCVAFIIHAKKADQITVIDNLFEVLIQICSSNVKCTERFVQLACGWLLREMSLCNKEKTLDFIEKNIQYFSREGLRYSLEKLSSKESNYLLKLHSDNKNKS